MSELHSSPAETVSEEQVATLHDQAERLFMAGSLRFGGPDVGRHYDARNKIRVRYEMGDELVTITCPTRQQFARSAEGVPPVYDSSLLKLSIESPLPSTDRWPNTYVKHELMLPKKDATNSFDGAPEGAGYLHAMSIVHYSAEGVLEDDVETGIMNSLATGSDMLPPSDEAAQHVFGQLASFQHVQSENMSRVYPDFDQLLQPEWTRDYCMERIAMLNDLSAIDEVGCEPNPYIRD